MKKKNSQGLILEELTLSKFSNLLYLIGLKENTVVKSRTLTSQSTSGLSDSTASQIPHSLSWARTSYHHPGTSTVYASVMRTSNSMTKFSKMRYLKKNKHQLYSI